MENTIVRGLLLLVEKLEQKKEKELIKEMRSKLDLVLNKSGEIARKQVE